VKDGFSERPAIDAATRGMMSGRSASSAHRARRVRCGLRFNWQVLKAFSCNRLSHVSAEVRAARTPFDTATSSEVPTVKSISGLPVKGEDGLRSFARLALRFLHLEEEAFIVSWGLIDGGTSSLSSTSSPRRTSRKQSGPGTTSVCNTQR
jgi:hypothetical protein